MAPSGGASRQKSCNACVRSKRRCDKRVPACSNCTKKRYLCVYGGQLDMQLYNSSLDASMNLDSFSGPSSTSCGDGSTLDGDELSATFSTEVMNLSSDPPLQIDSTLESLLDSIAQHGFGETPGPFDLLRQSSQVASAPTGKSLSREDYTRMWAMCDEYAPWQLSDTSTRISYTVNVFKNFHTTFAQENSTIYMHRQLYVENPPRWILQAYSTCAIYKNQTEATRGLVLRILHENINILKETASGTALTPLEKLARVHALIAYQTIRMFDGDITLGQQVDNDLPLLSAWNAELVKLRDNLEEFAELDDGEIRKKPPESWERWFFAESVRRTYLICIVFEALWDLLKGRRVAGITDLGYWKYVHRWSLSKHLWKATSPLDFFRAWREKPMWIISAFDFDEFVRTGTGDDIDDFAMFFLALSFGVNEMQMFCDETSRRTLA
ncbi:uncharacterized protein F4822DRAFT_231243 [Hypoxylon trugodes]|uniref:uncharacterized protein n=1 Tax=Hypoxylon trugodes TaxID=326681 RepID=UPI002192637C|nr:uncharacterized protein F4822DRAFT_231243 [Hypoxylon trugodes]KAI1390277.1 hypothetical protein F4822DRAFT_231243 [Hypoxylon trugodes]